MGVPGDLAVDIRRDEDRSRLGRDLEPRCDIRHVAKNFAGRLHDIRIFTGPSAFRPQRPALPFDSGLPH